MVMQPRTYQQLNFSQSALLILRTHGWRAFYTAHLVNFCRESMFLATYFTTYENLKAFLELSLPASIAIPISGGMAGAAGWFLSFPLDLIKGNIQSQCLHRARSPDRLRALALARDLVQSRGLWGFYSGVTPSILRAFLVSSSRFVTYEGCIWLLQRLSS